MSIGRRYNRLVTLNRPRSPTQTSIIMTRHEIENQMLTKSLDMSGKEITKTPGVCGGEACIAGTRIAVWLLVEAQQLGISEAQLLQDYPHITSADLVNAWSYADAYSEEIAVAIRLNQDV
jgi:uncharacterized protein (DUF433 family)